MTIDSMKKQNEPTLNLGKVCLIVLVAYLVLTIGFYFLAGDQLRYRDSRGNVTSPTPESGTVELVQGAVVEQRFTISIQRLERVSVQWGTYYRANTGTAFMELWRMDSEELLLKQSFDVSAIPDGGFTTLTAETPMEGLYGVPLMLRLYADSQLDMAASPLMSTSVEREEDDTLSLNGTPVEALLCLGAEGQDYIWTGLHYWTFVAIGLTVLLAFFTLVWYRLRKGHSYVVNALVAVQKYRFLIRQLVSRDFKTKYKRSVLGIFWSFLNPLLMMAVQYFVFSNLFRYDIPNYPVYLLIGIVCFNFFSEACGMSLTSILGNGSLITKVYMPKYIYPLTRVISSVINFSISLIPLLLVCLITGVRFEKSAVLSFYFFACIVIFTLGLGMLLATSMVFFRDTQFLWGVLSMIWMYATPIFYPESILPEQFKFVLTVNPLYHFLKNARICILNGISPEPIIYVQCFLIALAMLVVGTVVFCKCQDRFVLYL